MSKASKQHKLNMVIKWIDKGAVYDGSGAKYYQDKNGGSEVLKELMGKLTEFELKAVLGLVAGAYSQGATETREHIKQLRTTKYRTHHTLKIEDSGNVMSRHAEALYMALRDLGCDVHAQGLEPRVQHAMDTAMTVLKSYEAIRKVEPATRPPLQVHDVHISDYKWYGHVFDADDKPHDVYGDIATTHSDRECRPYALNVTCDTLTLTLDALDCLWLDNSISGLFDYEAHAEVMATPEYNPEDGDQ